MEEVLSADQALRLHGLRVTAPRVAVLEFLAASLDHPTADDVEQAVNRQRARASRASVYNVLRSLRDAGLVRELVLDDAVCRYDANLSTHHHFVCRRCRRVEDVPAGAFSSPAPPVRLEGRHVETATLVLHGLCVPCVAEDARTRNAG